MLACVKCKKRLGAYMDGELSGRKQAALERHLAMCSACRAALNDLRALKPLLSTLDVSPAPENLTSRILSRAYGQKKRRETHSFWVWIRTSGTFSWAATSATAAALIIGLAMGAYMGWGSLQANRTAHSGLIYSSYISGDNFFYAFETLSAAPAGSIEAAIISLMEDKR